MDRYEDQPADVLFRDLFDLGKKTTWSVDDQMEYDEDVAAIKHAVIRESSVGEVEVKIRESEDELTAPKGSPDRIVTMSEQFICQEWIPEGKYGLVKKEEK